MSANDSYELLFPLLPSSSYALAYALPLFFTSALLAFAGAFLTLDRSRSFAPSTPTIQSASKPKRVCPTWLLPDKWSAALQGGIGGLASGYAFGVHFSTFLALLVPNETSSSRLSPKEFVAVWIFSAVPCMLIAGRWKYAAIIFSAVSGFVTLALALSVIAHPTLLARIVLASVFMILGLILCLLPFSKLSRVSLRLACASAGAFGIVLSIAIMSRVSAWADVWERFWVADGSDWGTSKEKGLSAAYCLLLTTGLVSDWFLHLRFGENPDEKWDRYLANYTVNLPDDRRRAGSFTPLVSLWDRIFGQHRSFAPVVPDTAFLDKTDHKAQLFSSPISSLSKQRTFPSTESVSELLTSKPRPKVLRAKVSTQPKDSKRGRRAIKFQPLDEEAGLSSDDDDDDEETYLGDKPRRSRSLRTDSSATLTNSRKIQDAELGLQPPQRGWAQEGGEVPEYSDYEEDITVASRRQRKQREQNQRERGAPGWTPEFIRRHSMRAGPAANAHHVSASAGVPAPMSMPMPMPVRSQTLPVPETTSFSMAPSFPVPATPSLIRAVERINAAQDALYSSSVPSAAVPSTSTSAPVTATATGGVGDRHHRGQAWNSFWTDVKAKAST